MIQMMEKYSNNLEQLIGERMKEVEEEKKRSEMLLYKMLPKLVLHHNVTLKICMDI